MKNPIPILLPALLLLLPAASPAEPLAVHEWAAVPNDPRPYVGRIPHGSAARLVATLPGPAASATFHWQTNGMGAAWWEVPAEASSNAVSVLWTPAMDSGAAVHRAFFRIEQPEGPDYSAFATLAMLDSPGFAPNALPLPVQRLDFAAVAWTNAPWAPLPAPVAIPDGSTATDAHGCVHIGPVEIGEGAAATLPLDGLPTGTVVRSVSVAIGAGADATDPAHPEKQQAVAIGNQARAEGVNSVAIGSGVRHADEDDMSGANAYARGAQAIAIGYSAKAVGDKAVQIGTGTNTVPDSIQVNSTLVMRGGEVVFPEERIAAAAGTAATNIFTETLGNRLAILDQPAVQTNGYATVSISAWSASGDADHRFVVAVSTNDAADAATIQVGSGPRLDIYKAATVDRLIAAATNAIATPDLSAYATTNLVESLHPPFREYASATYDRIAAEAIPAAAVSTNRTDTYARVGQASGYALRAVRASRSGGMDTETEIAGEWAIVGSTDAATITSNVLHCTSAPGDVTVEFSPSDGSAAMRAAVSMPGDAVRTAATWPAGEISRSWRRDAVDYPYDAGYAIRSVTTNSWNGSAYICTNRLECTPYLGPTTPNPAFELGTPPLWYAARRQSNGSSIAGGLLGVAPHYALCAAHCGHSYSSVWITDYSNGASVTTSRGTQVAQWGDIRLVRTPSEIPAPCRARFLRSSVLAGLSPSLLFRSVGVAWTQHGTLVPCLVEPRPSRADLTGSTWDNGWVYVGARAVWRNEEFDGGREYSHAAHAGDSGHPVFLCVRGNFVPIGLFHWADGGGECLLSDTILDKLAAAIERDSGGAETVSFYTQEELQ